MAVTDEASSLVIQVQSLSKNSVLQALGKPPGVGRDAGDVVFDVKAIINGDTILDSFDVPVTITYQYTDEDVIGLDESSLWLYHYHRGTWQALESCALDQEHNSITCTTNGFSIFGLFGNGVAGEENHSSENGQVLGATSNFCSYLPPKTVPDLFQIDVTDTNATLYFTPLVSDVTNYYVSYGFSSGEERFGTFTDLAASTGVHAFTINELSPNSTYYFKVRPYNSCMPGEWSNHLKVTTAKQPGQTVVFYKSFLSKVLPGYR